MAQVATSCLDWIIAAAVLYILLPDSLPLTFGRFLGIFLLAQIAGVASNVPGGIGIFEAIILVFLAPFFSASAILGALVAFRVIYYLLPLLVAIAAAGDARDRREARRRRQSVADLRTMGARHRAAASRLHHVHRRSGTALLRRHADAARPRRIPAPRRAAADRRAVALLRIDRRRRAAAVSRAACSGVSTPPISSPSSSSAPASSSRFSKAAISRRRSSSA